ncbi:hypothetical protein ACFL6C_06450 [Myxococcota bacterium]
MRVLLTLAVVVALPVGTAWAVEKNLSVTTDEDATCRGCNAADTGCDADTTYEEMATVGFTFSTTGGTTHEHTLDLPCDADYTFHVRCLDGSGNANATSSQIDFGIAAEGVDPTPDGGPDNGGQISSGCGCNGGASPVWLALCGLGLLLVRRPRSRCQG